MLLTETWLNKDVPNNCIIPPGYQMFRWDRDSRGGGVAIIVKNSVSAVLVHCNLNETVWCRITFANNVYLVGVVYRPPVTQPEFLDKLNLFLCAHVKSTTRLILTGDFNLPHIDWEALSPGHVETSSAEILLEILISHNLRQIVNEETRVTPESRSLLDLLFISQRVGDYTISVEEGISDHKMIAMDILHSIGNRKRPFVPIPIKDYVQADDTSVIDFLECSFSQFQLACDCESVEELWQRFKGVINHCVNRFIPTRFKKTKQQNPWINRKIIHMKRKINRLRKRKDSKDQISQVRRNLKTALNESRQQFFNRRLGNFLKTSPEKFWRFFSEKKESIDHVQTATKMVTERKEIADCFNEFFQSVFSKDNGNSYDGEQFNSFPCCMEDFSITRVGVFQQLLELDVKKASGPDEIPTAFLQRYAEWVSFYLEAIFQKSLQTHSLPQDWRSAIVIPIFKGGVRAIVNNYRPVSLTSVSCKLLEHNIAKHIIIFLEENQLLYPHQHGFRSNLSTVTQLIETIHDFSLAINDQRQIDVICIDFAKAFDKVSHNKLLFKLRQIGISSTILEWIEAYLINRRQVVRVDDCMSCSLEVFSGVPQGSVLGPLLFLLYINDIASIVEPGVEMKLFADDCLLYSVVTNVNEQIKINRSLQALNMWCEKWDMEINYTKSTFTHITKKKSALCFRYNIGNNFLNNVNSFKYLGVTITHDLNWRKHVENVCSKASKKLYFLRKKLHNATKNVKLIAYKTFVRSVLEYASAVWSPHQKVLKSKLERIQRLAVRFVCAKYKWTDSVTSMLDSCDLELLETRRQKHRLILFFQLIHGQIKINKDSYVKLPCKRSDRLNHNLAIEPFNARVDVFRYSFFPDVIESWNTLPSYIVDRENVREFESLLDVYYCCERC